MRRPIHNTWFWRVVIWDIRSLMEGKCSVWDTSPLCLCQYLYEVSEDGRSTGDADGCTLCCSTFSTSVKRLAETIPGYLHAIKKFKLNIELYSWLIPRHSGCDVEARHNSHTIRFRFRKLLRKKCTPSPYFTSGRGSKKGRKTSAGCNNPRIYKHVNTIHIANLKRRISSMILFLSASPMALRPVFESRLPQCVFTSRLKTLQ